MSLKLSVSDLPSKDELAAWIKANNFELKQFTFGLGKSCGCVVSALEYMLAPNYLDHVVHDQERINLYEIMDGCGSIIAGFDNSTFRPDVHNRELYDYGRQMQDLLPECSRSY